MAKRTSHSGRAAPAGVSGRTKAVWAALTASMTGVGGLLFMLAGGVPAGASQGVALSPLVATSAPSSVESIFRTRSDLQAGRWGSIVLHHSGSPVGAPAALEAQHRAMGLAGLGYHFVVGNGAGMADGEIHVGYRWLDQLPGAHVAGQAGDTYNRISIGICLVGDGDRRAFTDAQVRRLAQLVAALADRLEIPTEQIVGHAELAATSSPGRMFPWAAFREQVRALRR